jgi:hypothetical protein
MAHFPVPDFSCADGFPNLLCLGILDVRVIKEVAWFEGF